MSQRSAKPSMRCKAVASAAPMCVSPTSARAATNPSCSKAAGRSTSDSSRLASLELSLVLRPAAFEHEGFVAALAEVGETHMGAALATALQRIEGFAERCDIARRRGAYLRAVEVLLGTTNVDLRDADEVAAF